jgi:hypothetical protein
MAVAYFKVLSQCSSGETDATRLLSHESCHYFRGMNFLHLVIKTEPYTISSETSVTISLITLCNIPQNGIFMLRAVRTSL